MSNAVAVSRASLWRETLTDLKPALKVQWRWVLGVAVVFALLQFLMVSLGADPSELRRHPELVKQHPELPARMYLFLFGQTLLGSSCIYLLTVLYLQTILKKSPPQLTFGNFFYWLGQYILWILAILVPLFSVGAILGVVTILKAPKIFMIAAVILAVVAFVFCMHIMLRLYVVSPIAIFRRKPILKNSWELTKGQCWRIFWNALMPLLIIYLVFAVPLIAAALVSKMFAGTLVAKLFSSVIQGGLQSVIDLSFAIFMCTTYRILLRERKAASLDSSSAQT